MVLDISEIEYLFIVLKYSAVEYLVFFLFFFFSTFCFYWNGLNNQTQWLDISQQTIKWLTCPCQEDAWYSRSFMREEMQELAWNVLHELSKKMVRKRKVIYIYIYKKMRLRVALCGGKWKKRKIRRWGRSERVDEKKRKRKNKGFGFG